MAIDSTRVRPGMLPPIISTTPNSPTVWAKPSTAPDEEAGPSQRQGDGEESAARARRAAWPRLRAAGRPWPRKALRIGCTTKGRPNRRTEPMTRPVKVKARVRAPNRLARAPPGPSGPSSDEQIEAEHGGRQHHRQARRRPRRLPSTSACVRASHQASGVADDQQQRAVATLASAKRQANRRPRCCGARPSLDSGQSVAVALDDRARLRPVKESEKGFGGRVMLAPFFSSTASWWIGA